MENKEIDIKVIKAFKCLVADCKENKNFRLESSSNSITIKDRTSKGDIIGYLEVVDYVRYYPTKKLFGFTLKEDVERIYYAKILLTIKDEKEGSFNYRTDIDIANGVDIQLLDELQVFLRDEQEALNERKLKLINERKSIGLKLLTDAAKFGDNGR